MYDEQSESEDELTSGHGLYPPTPLKHREVSKYQDSLTPLATKFSGWRASSLGKKTPAERSERKHALFSPEGPTLFDKPEQREIAALVDSPKFSFFEDEIAVHDEEGNESLMAKPNAHKACIEAGPSQESHPSEDYGDENVLPLDPQLPNSEPVNQPTLTCIPQNVFSSQSREIHTVSKVPLRPSADDLPMDLPRKRSRSLAGPLTDINASQNSDHGVNDISLPVLQDMSVNEVTSGPPTALESVVSEVRPQRYVDVHTTEGADANGIFLNLLTQMGAR